jgi:O-acetyl-ADP-ribose deacetylase (regulator of RNase III)
MIIHHKPSNIVRAKEGIIVHGCNAQSVMGSGVAKQLRAKYPEIFYDYCLNLEIYAVQKINPLGQVIFVPVSKTLKIANAITQEFYGRDGSKYVSYSALEQCLDKVAQSVNFDTPIHIPYLIGAGLGGGNEEIILNIIENTLKDNEVHFHHWK